MKIQLFTQEKKVLYELEQSELFPDYRSVLSEAIALKIDLTGLVVDSEQLDGMTWLGTEVNSVFFRNCSLKKNEFINCNFNGLYVGDCDFTSSKFKKSTLNDLHILNSNYSKARFRNCSASNLFFLDCNFNKAAFHNCRIDDIAFNSTNLSETFFYSCKINKGNFIHSDIKTDWLRETGFVGCNLSECQIDSAIDISGMYLWETNVQDIQLIEEECFTEVVNKNSKVLYAIYSNVVWWKPLSLNDEKRIFRGSLEEFYDEVQNGFPTTDLYPEMDDFEIEEELLRVCKYLESWKNNY
ncbi:MAG: pentapeptide repeat-containing protein [Prolixibacteraceae bacterium]|nr:pentapeptide repeat-containing protein [Prolixibacteraceae bacterium]